MKKLTCSSVHFHINACPQPIQVLHQPTLITSGDTHGNTLRLLHLLVNSGAFELSTEQYDALLGIYNRAFVSGLSVKDFQTFSELLQRIEINPGYDQHVFRLLGDFINDRGANDALTFEALRIFREKGLKIETFSGNHEQIFWFKLYEYILKTHPSATSPSFPALTEFLADPENETFFRSGQQFFNFLSIAPVDMQQRLLDECYHYLNTTHFVMAELAKNGAEETEPSSLEITSHAPLDFNAFDALLKDKFHLPGDSLLEQAQALDLALHTKLQDFCAYLQALCKNESVEADAQKRDELLNFLFNDEELDDFLNGRDFDFNEAINHINLANLCEIQYPNLLNIYFIHGHTGRKNASLQNEPCLPEELIKNRSTPHLLTAKYNRLFIHLINLDSETGQSYAEPNSSEPNHINGSFYCRTQALSHFYTPQERAEESDSNQPAHSLFTGCVASFFSSCIELKKIIEPAAGRGFP